MKKLFLGLLVTAFILGIVSIYVLVAHTNLIATPTYTMPEDTRLVLDGQMKAYRGDIINNDEGSFVNIDILKDVLNLDMVWDTKNEIGVFYDGNKIFRFYSEELTIKVNQQFVENKNTFLYKDGQAFINFDFIKEHSDYSYSYIEDTDILIIDKKGSIKRLAVAKNKARLRKKKSVWSEVEDIADIDEEVFIYDTEKEWSYARTSRGLSGYVKNSDVDMKRLIDYDEEKEVKKEEEKSEKINITWEFVYRTTPSANKLKEVQGLDVIAPTWFELQDEEGNLYDKGSKEYVKWAHGNNYKVWGVFNNAFNLERTNKIVNDAKLREKVISKIIDLALYYDLDGINIDFENVYLKDKDMFTQFIKELSPIARENDLTLSIDVTIKSKSENWSMFYDREKLGELVDYVILMAYDEYPRGSKVSGSVASIPWVERGIKTLLDEVPNNKVILGVPFYNRIWKEEIVDGEIDVTPYAVSMERAEELLRKYNGEVKFDENTNQYYGEYRVDGDLYKVWLENEHSMKERIKLIKKYDLSGIASWRRGFEKEGIWSLISQNLND